MSRSFVPGEVTGFAKNAVNNEWGYVWGASGQKYNETVAQTLWNANKKSYADGKNSYDENYFKVDSISRWKDHVVVDCSGLFQVLRGEEANAAGLFNTCDTTGKYSDLADSKIQMTDKEGLLLFKRSGNTANGSIVHVGVSDGKGNVYHSKSSVKGVVFESQANETWVSYGLPKWINF